MLLDYFEFFDSDFSFTLSFILKRREKPLINANYASTSDVAQALILDHFVSTGLVFIHDKIGDGDIYHYNQIK